MELKDQVHQVTIRAPLQSVWEEITRLKGIQKPFFNTVLEAALHPGGKLLYRSPDGKRVFILGEVLECTPPVKLVHTFRFTGMDEGPTLVSWELKETPGGVVVTVSHTRWKGQKVTHNSVLTSWPVILDNIRCVLETGNVPLGTRIKHGMMQALAFMMPGDHSRKTADTLETRLPD